MREEHVHYDLRHQVIQCAVCARMEIMDFPIPAGRFLALISSFKKRHQHRELSHQQRMEAIRCWREDLEA